MTFVTLLFLDFSGVMHGYLGWVAKIQLIPAVLAFNVAVVLLLVVLTLVFGRIYCSVVCPLGIMQDLLSSLRRKRLRYRFSPEKRLLRYTLLAVFCLCLALGLGSAVALLEPYSAYGRIAQNLLQPLWVAGNNVLASVAERHDSYAFYTVDVWVRSVPTLLIAAVTLVAVGAMALHGGRSYCNTICPVGTLLGLVSRFSLLKICLDPERCRQCGKCERSCKAACIDVKHKTVDHSRCVVCGNCLEQCAFDSLHYVRHAFRGVTPAADTTTAEAAPDPSRRSFLLGMAMAGTAAALAKVEKQVDGGLAAVKDRVQPERLTQLTPPGSLSAANMQRHCTACQLCVSECPNGVLRPSTSLLTLMQPVMGYERGYCRPECSRCSAVCPTGAIRPVTPEQKVSIQIGHAVWVRQNCVVLTDGVSCGNCARHCPVGAITMVPLDPDDELSEQVPAVDETRCIGCGACEHLCPARPFAAIYVEGHETHREV